MCIRDSLYSVLVNAKHAVEAGQPIGISGSTGRSTGAVSYTHLDVYKRQIIGFFVYI